MKKKIALIGLALLLGSVALATSYYRIQAITISNFAMSLGTTSPPVSSALLDMESTTQGILPPRMTTTQQNAISSPATGLQVFNTTLAQPTFWNGTAWLAPPTILVPPSFQSFTSGSGTYNLDYTFIITSGSATAAATYTNNSVTFTVNATVASATQVVMHGSGPPTASGTLTKSGGTGDSTLTFSQFLTPKVLRVSAQSSGGAGAGTTSNGGPGSDSSFGTSLVTGTHGSGGDSTGGAGDSAGNNGGGCSINAPAFGYCAAGSGGGAGQQVNGSYGGGTGGGGGCGGGGGAGAASGNSGNSGLTNSGGGGGGAGSSGSAKSQGGGGGGGCAVALIPNPSATYSYSVGGATSGGSGSLTGGSSAAGFVSVEAYY